MKTSNLFLFSFKNSFLNSQFSIYSKSLILPNLSEFPKTTDSKKEFILKSLTMQFCNIGFKGQYAQYLQVNTINQAKAIYYKNSLSNLKFDISQAKEFIENIKPARVKYLRDENKYKFINKKFNYLDLSTQNILKILNNKSNLKGGKLSNNAYKKALRHLKNKSPLSEHTLRLVNGYLRTIKGSLNKSSLQALNNKNKPQIQAKYKGLNYSVRLKIRSYNSLFNPSVEFRFNKKINIINSELKLRIKNSFVLDNLRNSQSDNINPIETNKA